MTTQPGWRLGLRILIIHDELTRDTATGAAARRLISELESRDVDIVRASSATEGGALTASDASIQCVLLDWDLAGEVGHESASRVLVRIREHNNRLPIFLIADRSAIAAVPLAVMQQSNDFIWLLEDTPDFISGRIVAATERYREHLLPPMFGALVRFAKVYEYSWHTPGHTGGVAFLKSPAGRAFFEFFGENLLRSDLSISVGELGSLLDHSGPIGDSERYAAGVFGAHRTYYVTNGSSTSNRIILTASVTRDQVALCDRNCHKSVEHGMTLSGAIPTYLMPSRNRYGIIGPIHAASLAPAFVRQLITENPLVHEGIDPKPAHVVITNSTYDGLCYNVTRVEEILDGGVDRLHFDEAWYGYARFNPIYRQRFAMNGASEAHGATRPTIFATQSTHKLLAALSQASMIHVRDGRNPISHSRFNEAFMMHASTSPQYAIIASNDVSAAMMDGAGGEHLTTESICEAVAFRQVMARLSSDFAKQGEWFFDGWQPQSVHDAVSGVSVPFYAASPEQLVTDPDCWVLHPDELWHGFGALEDGYCMLDPIKVSILTPGVEGDGRMAKHGIPAPLVTAYLDQQGIEVEKTTDFTILFLFSIGITKGKWGTLVSAFLGFKRDYDANAPLLQVLPRLAAANPKTYEGMGLKDVGDAMFGTMRELQTLKLLDMAFSTLPRPEVNPSGAYESLVRGNVEAVALDHIAQRTVATAVVPYPPGIPLLMPGEGIGADDGVVLSYLRALEAYDRQHPSFTHDIHGVEVVDGCYRILCLTATTRPSAVPAVG
ncbi:Orn/Lys/Arg family decarboxylase [Lichenicola cladoniae]|nr:Orn/Lys/Arg decarboxylase N-terminal domain-containing protein [Lichenicola cladoniae]